MSILFRSLSSIYYKQSVSSMNIHHNFSNFIAAFSERREFFFFLSNADYFREKLVTIVESIELHVTEHSVCVKGHKNSRTLSGTLPSVLQKTS